MSEWEAEPAPSDKAMSTISPWAPRRLIAEAS